LNVTLLKNNGLYALTPGIKLDRKGKALNGRKLTSIQGFDFRIISNTFARFVAQIIQYRFHPSRIQSWQVFRHQHKAHGH
jgi:hypothetical protein